MSRILWVQVPSPQSLKVFEKGKGMAIAEVVRSYYNGGMPRTKTSKMETLPEVDLVELIKNIENLTGYNQRQMAETLGVPLKTYQYWRFSDRVPNGKAIGRLFLLCDQLEEKLKVKIMIPIKEKE